MKRREFNRVLKSCTEKGQLVAAKVEALPADIKSSMTHFIIRRRQPVIVNLIPSGFDIAWLASMGYLYRTKGKLFEFVHTCEHDIK